LIHSVITRFIQMKMISHNLICFIASFTPEKFVSFLSVRLSLLLP